MSYEFADGKGPCWIGNSLPNLPPALEHAQSLPPKITPRYVFFFGFDRPEPECCLQQWYPSPFSCPGGRNFSTAEQYMMYHKALLMGDEEIAQRVLNTGTPAQAKALGRAVRGFRQDVWDRECDRVVEEGNWEKFRQNEGLGRVLVGEIVEASPNDRLWGIGFDTEHAEGNESRWGENKLGKALMRVRDRLVKGQ